MHTMNQIESECHLCPRDCGVNRHDGQRGFCNETADIRIARASLHYWEEPCISGQNGSGTVFFSGCNLRCIFCQNRQIALGDCGQVISLDGLSDIFMKLQDKGANNINLVTPTPFILQIAQALKYSRQHGLTIPIVYNTSAYERVESLRYLEGLVDIYMPDLKYMDGQKATAYADAPDYPSVAVSAIAEMVRQQPRAIMDEKSGLMKKGVLVRHLVLPQGVRNAQAVLNYLFETYKNDIYYSIMNQYTPLGKFPQCPELERRITKREYEKVVDYTISLGIENAYIQEGETAKESFIPRFTDCIRF